MTTTTKSRRQARLEVTALEDRLVMSTTAPLLQANTYTAAASPAGQAASAVSSFLDKKVVAFDVTTSGTLSFNLSTGNYAAEVELPAGMKLDTTALKTLMSGQLALPKIDPVKAASAFASVKTSVSTNYDQVRDGLYKQYGGGNVYVSTQRFTDWASPENVATTAATAVVTGGATAGQIVQEAKEVILGELGNIYTWLQNKAGAEAQATLANALKAMVTGKDMDSPYVAVKFLNVTKTYTVGLGGAAAFVADGLGAGQTSASFSSTHKGFAVIWKGPGDSLPTLNSALARFDGASLSGKSGFTAALGKLAALPELKSLGAVAQAVLTTNASGALDNLVIGKLSAALGLTPAQLRQLYKPGNPVVDLKATDLDERLASSLAKLAAGNEGKVTVSKLEFNLTTSEVTAKVDVRHRHSWGSVTDILAAVGKKVGEWADSAGNYVKQRLDAAGNTVREVAHKAADKVTEVFDKAGALLRKTVVNSLGYKTLDAAWTSGTKTLETVRDRYGNMVSDYFKSGSRFVQQEFKNGKVTLERQYENGKKVVEGAWNNGVKTAYTTWNTANQKLSAYWKDGVKEYTQSFTAGVVSYQKVVQGGVKVAESMWKNTVQTMHTTWSAAGTKLTDYWRDGAKEVSQWFTGGKLTSQQVLQGGVKTAFTTWNTANQKLTDWWKEGSKEFHQWFTNGKVSYEKIFQGTVKISEQAWENGVKTMSYIWDAAGRRVSKFWTSGGQKVYETYQNGERVAQDVYEGGKKIAQHAWNSTGGYLGNAITKGGGVVGGLITQVGSWF